jgi:D-sedoheptulose 7-phosphate isomerase
MNVIAMTGAKGAALKDIADIAIVIPSEEVARIQEVHELLLHAWCEAVDVRLSES